MEISSDIKNDADGFTDFDIESLLACVAVNADKN